MSAIISGNPATPVTACNRLPVIDVLRGVALIGMIIVHFYYESNYSETGINGVVSSGINLFIDSRFYTLFAILFGAGFALQLRSSQKKDKPFVSRYLRRLLVLFAIGVVIEIAFGYNILVRYALCGAPLLLIMRWPTKAVVALALVFAMFIPIYKTTLGTAQTILSGGESAKVYNDTQRSRMQNYWKENHIRRAQASTTTDYTTALSLRAVGFKAAFSDGERLLLDYAWTFMLFLIGLLGVRAGVFEHVKRKRKLIAGFMAFGLVSWALAVWFLPFFEITDELRYPNVAYPVEQLMTYLSFGLLLVRYEWLTLTYIGIILLLSVQPAWLRRLAFFSWVGRMALTNYVIQVVIVSLLFNNYAFGAADIEPVFAPLYAVVLFVCMVVFSRWWLSHYQFGPVEWLWRSATYLRWQPLRNRPASEPEPFIAAEPEPVEIAGATPGKTGID